MGLFIGMVRIFLHADEGHLCNGKWLKNQDFKIDLAQRYGTRGQGSGTRDQGPEKQRGQTFILDKTFGDVRARRVIGVHWIIGLFY